MIADFADGLRHTAFEAEGIIAAGFLEALLGRHAMGQGKADKHIDRGPIVGWKLIGIIQQPRQEDVPIAGLAGGTTNVANQRSSRSVDLARQAFGEDFQRRRGPPRCHPQLMHEFGVPARFSQGMAQAVAHACQANRLTRRAASATGVAA